MADDLGFFLSVPSVHSLEKPAVSMAGTGQQHTLCPLQCWLLSPGSECLNSVSNVAVAVIFVCSDRNARCFPFNNLDAKLENVNYAEAVFYFCQKEIKMECAHLLPTHLGDNSDSHKHPPQMGLFFYITAFFFFHNND